MMIAIGILLFALLVIVHEFGHFWTARRNGVEVEEFGIGFPPRLYGKQAGGTLYSINALPLGGFVKMKGESDSDRREGSFGAASLWVKTKILMAGVGMNLLAAFVILLVLALTQMPTLPGIDQFQVPQNQTVTESGVVALQVVEDSPASASGLEAGDRIVRIADEEIEASQQLVAATQNRTGEEVAVTFERGGSSQTVEVTLGEEDAPLGIAPVDLESNRYTWAAPVVALGLTVQMVGLVLAAVGDIITSLLAGAGAEAAEDVAGPVGIIFLLQNMGDLGAAYLLILVASISVSLAVFNALPIPALDGGRLAVIAGARALKKRLSETVESSIHGVGFMALIGLLLLITYVDVQRFF